MKRGLVRGVVAIVILLAAMTFAVEAQVPTGTINGIVADPHQAVVTGAHVTATERTTGVTHGTVSNGDGVYSIPNLPTGVYDVRITAAGFAVSEFQGVQLEAGRASTLDAELKLAEVGQSVNVTDVTSTVELTQSMIQGQITSSTIENIRLNGRNFLELAYLVPGNRPAPNFDPTKTNTLEVSSDGSVGRGGNITVDGGENNDEAVGGALSNFPQDSIQEFQIATARLPSMNSAVLLAPFPAIRRRRVSIPASSAFPTLRSFRAVPRSRVLSAVRGRRAAWESSLMTRIRITRCSSRRRSACNSSSVPPGR